MYIPVIYVICIAGTALFLSQRTLRSISSTTRHKYQHW